MPGEFSNTGSILALNAVSGRAATAAATRFLALLGAPPADPADNITQLTEAYAPGAGGYARQSIAWSVPAGDPPGTANTNGWTWSFTAASVIYGAALVSTVSGTTSTTACHFIWTLTNPLVVGPGDTLTVNPGDLLITAD